MLPRLKQTLSIMTPTLRWFMLGMLLANTAGAMLYTYIALYLQELGATIGQVGLVFSVASIIPLALQIFGGWLSDTIGRLRTIAIGSAVASFGYVLFAVAPTWQWVIVAITLEYISGATVGPSYAAMIADESDEDKRGRIFGLSNGIFMIIGVVGPPLAGLLVDLRDYRFMIIVSGMLYWSATLLRIWMVRNQRFSHTRPKQVEPLRMATFRRETFKMIGMMLAGGLLTWILVLDGLSDVSARLSEVLQPLYLARVGGMKVVEIGILKSVFFLAMMVMTPPAGLFSDRIGEHRVIALGYLVAGAGMFVFIMARGIYGFAAAGILTGFGYGLVGPAYSSLTSKAVPEKNRGLAYGFFNTSIGLLSLPGPWLGAILWEGLGARVPFVISALAMLITAPFAFLKLRAPAAIDERVEMLDLPG